MADDPTPKADPTGDGPKEPETIGELVESIIGTAVPKAIEEARKSWAKDLADLLDIGADSSSSDDPDNPTPIVSDPVLPVADLTPAPSVRTRKFSLL